MGRSRGLIWAFGLACIASIVFLCRRAAGPKVSFLFVADTHGPAAENARLASLLAKESRVDALLHAGDFADSPGLWSAWWDVPFAECLRRHIVVAASGNHDDLVEFSRRFGLLPQVFSFGGDVSVFALPWAYTRGHVAWLDRQLASSRARWRVLLVHRPVWRLSGDLDEELLSVIRGRVHLVLSGHEHVSWDSVRDGVRQVVIVSGPKKYSCPGGAGGCRSGVTEYARIEFGQSMSVIRREVR